MPRADRTLGTPGVSGIPTSPSPPRMRLTKPWKGGKTSGYDSLWPRCRADGCSTRAASLGRRSPISCASRSKDNRSLEFRTKPVLVALASYGIRVVADEPGWIKVEKRSCALPPQSRARTRGVADRCSFGCEGAFPVKRVACGRSRSALGPFGGATSLRRSEEVPSRTRISWVS